MVCVFIYSKFWYIVICSKVISWDIESILKARFSSKNTFVFSYVKQPNWLVCYYEPMYSYTVLFLHILKFFNAQKDNMHN